MKRDLIRIADMSKEEVLDVLDMTGRLKKNRKLMHDLLHGKTIGLLFQKPSNRTRVSFEVGVAHLGGKCIYLSPQEINLGVRESADDVARTLSRYLDGIVARVNRNQDVVDLAKNSSIPVINGLCDLFHPCQGLTDIFSIKEKFHDTRDILVSYVGDGNNVCHSLLMGCAKIGMNIHIATPKGYEPLPDIVALAQECAKQNGSDVLVTHSPQDAVKNADVIYSDVWVSMGQEQEEKKRLKDFQGFQINSELVKCAKPDYVFMHCLPAHRGVEVTADIIDGPHSIVFDQAENRLHTQKAVFGFIFNRRRN